MAYRMCCNLIQFLLTGAWSANRRTSSVAAEDLVAALPEALRELHFHFHGPPEGHRVQVGVEAGHQPLAELAYDPGRLHSALVIEESLLRRQPGHAYVVAGPPVALRVPEVHHVDALMPGCARFFSAHNPSHSYHG